MIRQVAKQLQLPVYDVQIVGYPERMRAYNARLKASRSTGCSGDQTPRRSGPPATRPHPRPPREEPMTAGPTELRRSLLDVHRRLGAKMGAFAGWDMPIQYQGTMSEHQAVRESVGVFDLSHLGKVEVRGDGAHDTLQHALSNDLDRLTEPGPPSTPSASPTRAPSSTT